MAAKPVFTKEQHRLLQETAIRIWETQFKDQVSAPQKKMALALKVSQQTVSALLRGTYKPSLRVAKEISVLDGKNTLEELVGVYGVDDDDGKAATSAATKGPDPYANLTVCIQFHAASKHWSAWTIAAARAGFFGNADFAPPEWAGKLDHLEKALEKARRQ